jgi:hypothetical protein
MHPVERVHIPSKPSAGRLLLEMAMIVFSVLLALSLDSWREHRKERSLAREALLAIGAEIETDLDGIEKQRPAQERLAADLEQSVRQFKAGHTPDTPMVALHPAAFTSAAWNSAISTQAVAHMDLSTVQALSRFYDAQKWMDRVEDSWIRIVAGPAGADRASQLQSLEARLYLIRTYLEIEQHLTEVGAKAREAIPGAPRAD